ncbi:holo-ACP synthase [Flavihumibacter profundi]|uniref:holo-ACP synthase n=1 Tax=Flavihumibacter profundi TaxID=2716883 RepID=UPI001CC669B4|nr:holo-ACP synthase [Flavihumibacter profundi]MBZ5858872.1 holo-ACP synthase [Flavihumibacter profundi]
MILGTGIDIVEVQRIAEKIAKGQGFRELVFSPGEIAYCEKKAHPDQHFAARFAAKEAFLKALGSGWLNGTAFHEIEIVHDAKGQPNLRLIGQTAETLAPYGIKRIHVSLSHQASMATAIVILEN